MNYTLVDENTHVFSENEVISSLFRGITYRS